MTKEAKILITIAGLVLIGGGLLAVFANPQPQEPSASVDPQSLIREDSHMTQTAQAKVNIVEFGDFQCPACGQAHPYVKSLLEEYKDNADVNFVFRNFPLDAIHPNAHIAAEAAEAAGKQGKYWEMHDLLFERQEQWSTATDPIDIFVSYAQEIGLNEGEFKTGVSQRLFSDVITADYNDGVALGVNSTPTFFINGQKLEGGFNPAVVKEKIDQILSGQDVEASVPDGQSAMETEQPVPAVAEPETNTETVPAS
ncbi:MAG: thioredoxin domain-containing protein [Candidatus Doudnabacteria bacterium]